MHSGSSEQSCTVHVVTEAREPNLDVELACTTCPGKAQPPRVRNAGSLHSSADAMVGVDRGGGQSTCIHLSVTRRANVVHAYACTGQKRWKVSANGGEWVTALGVSQTLRTRSLALHPNTSAAGVRLELRASVSAPGFCTCSGLLYLCGILLHGPVATRVAAAWQLSRGRRY